MENDLIYFEEWYDYWNNNEFPIIFAEIWFDEEYQTKLPLEKTNSYLFYSNLWKEHRYSFFENKINQEIHNYIINYNFNKNTDYEKQINDILNDYL